MNKRQTGKEKEKQAEKYLEDKGYKILDVNFYTKQGEIDIIAKKDMSIVFVEVKYRKNEKFGHPCEAVDRRKQEKIVRAAGVYLYKNKYPQNTPCRFDIIAIVGDEISHYENAFYGY